MRAPGMNVVVASVVAMWCVIAVLPDPAVAAATADTYRAKRGVVPGNAAYRPKDTIRRSECRNDNNCKSWPKTSCAKDPADGQRRCLCADYTHPINDDCITSPQELGMACERDIQCIQLAYCGHNTSDTHSDVRVCQCREEYTDDDGSCSGGVRTIVSMYLAFIVAIAFQNNYN